MKSTRRSELADRIVVLSAKPTRMLETVDLKAPRPRDPNSAELQAARIRLEAVAACRIK